MNVYLTMKEVKECEKEIKKKAKNKKFLEDRGSISCFERGAMNTQEWIEQTERPINPKKKYRDNFCLDNPTITPKEYVLETERPNFLIRILARVNNLFEKK